jgi:hypothetical protein
MAELAYCGLDCQTCTYRETSNCPGCQASKGHLFWENCPLASCCIEKELAHCSDCERFPCEQLTAFAFDKDHGDNGQRIDNLRKI